MSLIEYKKIALVVSTKDIAGMNIRDALLQEISFEESGRVFHGHAVCRAGLGGRNLRLYTLEQDSIYAEHLDRELADAGFSPDLIIFLTKHQGGEGIKSLSCHSPGNWDRAEMGGSPKTLCPAPATMLKAASIALKKEAEAMGWLFSTEVTHHGPELDTPVMFMEIGSTKKEWPVKEAGKAVASAVKGVLTSESKPLRAVLLLGGGHYSHYAEKVQLTTDYAVGHACPKFMLQHVDKAMLMQALEKTVSVERPLVLLDWKGLGPEKARLKEMLNEEGIEYDRSDRFFKRS